MSHPIRSEAVQADVERKSRMLEACSSWGEVVVKFRLKDGRWTVGNVSVTFPRLETQHSAETNRDPLPHSGTGR